MRNHKKHILFILGVIIVTYMLKSCNYDYHQVPPLPKLPTATKTLEAEKVILAPSTINSPYWNEANYLIVELKDISTNQLYDDGGLNMTGTYKGLSSFNNGSNVQLKLKAAYDSENLYIYAEWEDERLDLSTASWLLFGDKDPLKQDNANGWTSQRNSDKLAFAFDINAATGLSGTFANTGCASSCHNGGGGIEKKTISGDVDVWSWNLARSAPLGYLEDKILSINGLVDDAGTPMYSRNSIGTGFRFGPEYEWDGKVQNVTLPDGQPAILDPAFYLLNKTPFLGDIANGAVVWDNNCGFCHGDKGEGESAVAVNNLTMNRKSRETLLSSLDNIPDMGPYWNPLTNKEKEDVLAFMRGLAGVPGYTLKQPTGSNADITSSNNISPIGINKAAHPSTNTNTKYQIVIIRKLNTNNPDDVKFNPIQTPSVPFGIALMDNDGKNHIGSMLETLTFK
jgi:hypothetical protein